MSSPGVRQDNAPEGRPDVDGSFALETRHLTKSFGALVANDDVSIGIRQGEVHALVGENGAGKTTLMNVCFGLLEPDSGEIYVAGDRVDMASPVVARRHGLGMVHQHFKLVPSLTVAENVFLGAEPTTRTGTLDRKKMHAELAQVAERFGLELNSNDRVKDLSAGAQQRVEILKALYFDARVLILDEPTAVLTPQETVGLFGVMRELAGSGRSVILITHKLREVKEVSDRFSVMRRGALQVTDDTADATERDITVHMVGREVDLGRVEPVRTPGRDVPVALECDGVTVQSDDGRTLLKDFSLQVHRGEILGIAGVEGNGQTELAEVIAGLRPNVAGRLRLDGSDMTGKDPAQRRQGGLAHIPEDRLSTGVSSDATVTENMVGGFFGSNLFPRGRYRKRLASRWVAETIKRYDVRGATPATTIGSLSGGNMQKVVVAREVETNPTVLLAAQPTRGVDIGATEFIHDQLRELRAGGAGVLLISADLNELLALSDRIVVMYRGEVAGVFPPDPVHITDIGLAMAGAADPATATGGLAVGGAAPPLPEAAPLAVGAPPAGRPRVARLIELHEDAGHRDASSRLDLATRSLLGGARRGAPELTQPVTAVLVALVIGILTLLATGHDPISAYRYFLGGSFTSLSNFSTMIAQLEPLLIVGVSVYLSFRGGVFNIGAEGQLYVGAFAGAWVAFTFTSLPGPLLILASIAAAAVAGAFWALVPGLLYAYYDVNIVVSTLMFNYVAMFLTAYLVASPFRDPTAGSPETKLIANSAHLPAILGNGGADIGLFIGLALLVVAAVALGFSRWGLQSRFVGSNQRFARYLGVDVHTKIVQLMLVSGAIAGIAGVVETLGTQFRFNQNFSPGYGFLGVTVALLGRLRPTGILLAGILYAILEAGAGVMQLNTGVPLALVQLLEGIIVVLMTGTSLGLWRRRRANQAPAAASPLPAATTVSAQRAGA